MGRIISKLTEHGIRNDTLIVFMSDNGPVSKVRDDKFIKNFKLCLKIYHNFRTGSIDFHGFGRITGTSKLNLILKKKVSGFEVQKMKFTKLVTETHLFGIILHDFHQRLFLIKQSLILMFIRKRFIIEVFTK